MCEFLSMVNFECLKFFSSCMYNSCIFSIFPIHLQFFICNQDFCTATNLLPLFDNFQYSLACKLNYISVFILNFFTIFLELTIK